jgi:hypothetical protein
MFQEFLPKEFTIQDLGNGDFEIEGPDFTYSFRIFEDKIRWHYGDTKYQGPEKTIKTILAFKKRLERV